MGRGARPIMDVPMDAILAVDLGTTALKCALHDPQGNVIAKAIEEYQLITPDALSVEVEVETYWQAFKTAIAKVLQQSQIPPPPWMQSARAWQPQAACRLMTFASA